MDFISNSDVQLKEMLECIGVKNVDELLEAIPESIRVPKITEDDGISEYEGVRAMETLAGKNTYPSFDNYLGAGSYEHHVPAIIASLVGRGEFLTAYTPYQAEASQGMLQALFEFQSAVCALTGLDVANASLYDGASACAEAILMALRSKKKRKKVLVVESLHPHYQGVVKQYLKSQDITLRFVKMEELQKEVDEDCAAVLFQYPNFYGEVENLKGAIYHIHEQGGLAIVSANPMVYGLYASAKELDADIAIGDTQVFGMPMQFGGPYAGYISCKQELVRQIPGRVVGETVDTDGARGFVLTLQAREQHIRREKATSNICTSQSLAAIATLIGMLWYGRQGVKALALTNFQRASYLREELSKVPGVKVDLSKAIFNEFEVEFSQPIEKVCEHFRKHKIEAGLPLGNYSPEKKQSLLVAVTECKNKEMLDRYIKVAKELSNG